MYIFFTHLFYLYMITLLHIVISDLYCLIVSKKAAIKLRTKIIFKMTYTVNEIKIITCG